MSIFKHQMFVQFAHVQIKVLISPCWLDFRLDMLVYLPSFGGTQPNMPMASMHQLWLPPITELNEVIMASDWSLGKFFWPVCSALQAGQDVVLMFNRTKFIIALASRLLIKLYTVITSLIACQALIIPVTPIKHSDKHLHHTLTMFCRITRLHFSLSTTTWHFEQVVRHNLQLNLT